MLECEKKETEVKTWNFSLSVSNKKTSYSLPTSPTVGEEPIWSSESYLKHTNKSTGPSVEDVTHKSDSSDWYKRAEAKSLNNDEHDDVYIHEVHNAIYGDTQGHPVYGSAEYFEAAQNYAVYGKDFYDFPDNLENIINENRGSCSEENGNAAHEMRSGNCNESFNASDFGVSNNLKFGSKHIFKFIREKYAKAIINLYKNIWA